MKKQNNITLETAFKEYKESLMKKGKVYDDKMLWQSFHKTPKAKKLFDAKTQQQNKEKINKQKAKKEVLANQDNVANNNTSLQELHVENPFQRISQPNILPYNSKEMKQQLQLWNNVRSEWLQAEKKKEETSRAIQDKLETLEENAKKACLKTKANIEQRKKQESSQRKATKKKEFYRQRESNNKLREELKESYTNKKPKSDPPKNLDEDKNNSILNQGSLLQDYNTYMKNIAKAILKQYSDISKIGLNTLNFQIYLIMAQIDKTFTKSGTELSNEAVRKCMPQSNDHFEENNKHLKPKGYKYIKKMAKDLLNQLLHVEIEQANFPALRKTWEELNALVQVEHLVEQLQYLDDTANGSRKRTLDPEFNVAQRLTCEEIANGKRKRTLNPKFNVNQKTNVEKIRRIYQPSSSACKQQKSGSKYANSAKIEEKSNQSFSNQESSRSSNAKSYKSMSSNI